MSGEEDRIAADIACLDTRELPASLVSTLGSHCDVWQTGGSTVELAGIADGWVVKHHRHTCTPREVAIMVRDYRLLRASLGEMIPEATYIRTRVNGVENVVVVAMAFTPWFNLANPANEPEALPLLQQLPRARDQLRRFLEATREWRAAEQRVIDLYGLDNLILDRNREIRYLDSFGVFFHEDLLYILDPPDLDLAQKIDLSLKRLDYLWYLLDRLESRSA